MTTQTTHTAETAQDRDTHTASRRTAPLIPAYRMTPKGFRALVALHARLLFRDPGAAFIAILPLGLLLIFGNIPSFRDTPQKTLGGRTVLDVFVPTFAAMVPLMLALMVLPGRMAMLREKNALRRFKVSPVPPAGMLAALLALVAALAAVGVALIAGIGVWVFGAAVPAGLGTVVAAFALGAAAVLALGLVVAAVAPTEGTANGFGAPLMILNFFFSGLYFPVAQMPHWLAKAGEFIPFGAVVDAWSGEGVLWQHLTVLGVYTLLGGIAAVKLFRWE
jgi:ABC-2 type transport system permease protein